MKRRHLLVGLVLALLATIPLPARQGEPLRSTDLAGLRLRNIGPATMSGRVVDMDVVESDPHVMYVASATGGIFRTRDNGITWEPVFEREAVHSVGDIAIFQPNPNIIWVGTGERANRQSVSWGDGVYKSTDAGKTWTNVGLKTSRCTSAASSCTRRTRTIAYVAAQGSVWGPGGERGLYRTLDGGKTWARTLHVDDDTGVTDVAMDWRDPNILYAASYQRRRSAFGFNGGGPGSALWKSTDAGATWTKLTGNGLPEGEYGRIGIAVYRKDPSVVYVSIEQGTRYNASTAYINRKGGLYRSNDRGRTWRFMSDWNPRPMYASQPTIDPQRRSAHLHAEQLLVLGQRRRDVHRAAHHHARRRPLRVGEPERLAPRHQAGRRRHRHLVRSRPEVPLRVVAAAVAVLPRGRRQRAPLQRLRRPAGQRLLDGPERELDHATASSTSTGRGCAAATASSRCPIPKDPRIVYSASQFLGLQRNDTRTWQSAGHPPGRSHRRHRRSPQLEHVGQERARAGAGQRHAPGQLGRAGADLAARHAPRSTPAASTCSARAIAASPGRTSAT